jgi:outer membrane murein-binding lipoprotein Lpp
MMRWGLHRRGLLLLCVAAVLLAGCVSKGKYTELESQYTSLQGQYTALQGQYQQLQQSSTAQAARSATEIATFHRI